MDASEIITVTRTTVGCDGGGGALGHPKVFLHIDDETREVMCPYCSRRFVLAEGVPAAAAH